MQPAQVKKVTVTSRLLQRGKSTGFLLHGRFTGLRLILVKAQ
jgi:hypothetical protein